MRKLRLSIFRVALTAALGIFGMGSHPAHAVPSFARQTGLSCEACHTVFPELTPFGRRFKLSGYTLTTRPGINDMSEERETRLSIQDIPPLSMMVMASTTWWNKPQADSQGTGARSQNAATQFPQQLGIFYAGRISDSMGAMLQVTYAQSSGSVSIDNSDIRYSDRAFDNELLYGVTVNNNPSVQDVWNTTPAWGYPTITPQVGATPTAAPVVSSLGQKVAGVGAYALYKDQFYGEVSVYRSAIPGKTQPYDSATLSGNAIVDNFAPYWRGAWEKNWGHNSFELGTYGMMTRMMPAGSNLAANTYMDAAFDTQYQYIGIHNIFSLSGSFLNEHINNNSANVGTKATNSSDTLNRFLATASYYYKRKYGLSVTFQKLTGSSDPLLYAAGATSGSANGSPNSQFEVLEADYMPWLNTKLLLQYTMYNQFNGGTSGYDGATTRTASDNNTLMLGIWTAF